MKSNSSYSIVPGGAVLLVVLGMTSGPACFGQVATPAGFGATFNEECAVCHGENLEGAAQGTPLVGVDLLHGDSMEELIRSIAEGYPEKDMPDWADTFSEQEIKSLALYISEQRDGYLYTEFNISNELTLPSETIRTEKYDLKVESVAEGLDPLPYSIAPLPDGRILLTEKMRGMRFISPSGAVSDLIEGTPTVYDDGQMRGGLQYGMGWLMDVALHPDYAENGWIYLHYTDRCSDCNTISRESSLPVTMNALVRARIRNGKWVDQETIWKADIESYSPSSDIAAGGRIAFDPEGFVFISVGVKGRGVADGIQDLRTPYGKTHRVHDDGRIPQKTTLSSTMRKPASTIWTYGHRSPQGLEFNVWTGQLWGTEHGPRGGDEVNLLLPGRNYGWPLYSLGQNYNGTEVDWGRQLGIEFDVRHIEQPVVDLTPSPAVSSFVFYEGDAFPAWNRSVIVGSLKAADLYRLVIDEDNELVHKERLLKDLARIRDVEVGLGGEVLLLLEHASGGRVVKLIPEPR